MPQNLSSAAVVIGALTVNCVVAVCVLPLFPKVLWVGLQSVNVAFPGHTHFLDISSLVNSVNADQQASEHDPNANS